MAMPFVKALDAFVECVLQTLIFVLASHGSSAINNVLKAGYDAPHSGHTVTFSDYLFRLPYADYHWDCIFPLS